MSGRGYVQPDEKGIGLEELGWGRRVAVTM